MNNNNLMNSEGWWETARLIVARLNHTGRKGFTYDGLRRTYDFYTSIMDCGVTWNTVERLVRKMVESGFLERKVIKLGKEEVRARRGRKKNRLVVFYPTPSFWEMVRRANLRVQPLAEPETQFE